MIQIVINIFHHYLFNQHSKFEVFTLFDKNSDKEFTPFSPIILY